MSSTKIQKIDIDDSVFDEIQDMVSDSLNDLETETWTFTMSDGSLVSKDVVVKSQ